MLSRFVQKLKAIVIGILAVQGGAVFSSRVESENSNTADLNCYGPVLNRETDGISTRYFTAAEIRKLDPNCVYRSSESLISKGLFGDNFDQVFPPKGQDIPGVMLIVEGEDTSSKNIFAIKREKEGTSVHIKNGINLSTDCSTVVLCDGEGGAQIGPSVGALEEVMAILKDPSFKHAFFPRKSLDKPDCSINNTPLRSLR